VHPFPLSIYIPYAYPLPKKGLLIRGSGSAYSSHQAPPAKKDRRPWDRIFLSLDGRGASTPRKMFPNVLQTQIFDDLFKRKLRQVTSRCKVCLGMYINYEMKTLFYCYFWVLNGWKDFTCLYFAKSISISRELQLGKLNVRSEAGNSHIEPRCCFHPQRTGVNRGKQIRQSVPIFCQIRPSHKILFKSETKTTSGNRSVRVQR